MNYTVNDYFDHIRDAQINEDIEDGGKYFADEPVEDAEVEQEASYPHNTKHNGGHH